MKRSAMGVPISSTDRTTSRRGAIRTLTTAGVAMAAFVAASRVLAEHAPTPHSVTVDTVFRSGPGPEHPAITVIPKGATFTLTTRKQNNFHGVRYNGKTGWVYAPLVVADDTSAAPSMVGEAYASSAVNLRSGPGPQYTVLRVVARDSTLNVSNTVQNGFRYVVHLGLPGWMADRYIAWRTTNGTGPTFATTADLHLRAEPDIGAEILLTMPAGATVTAQEGESNGFRKVTFLGTTGWAATAYLT